MPLISGQSPEPAEVLGRLAAALIAGGLIGFNREIGHKPAGLKTHALVALGSCLVTMLGTHLSEPGAGHNADATSRVIQGLLAGIGFLGGGAILRDGDGTKVHGLTTAATLWMVTCLGIACGLGAWIVAIFASILTVLILVIGNGIERTVKVIFPKKKDKRSSQFDAMIQSGDPPG
jgi:putative Mg2+ transporter-C (MgtC) family protein